MTVTEAIIYVESTFPDVEEDVKIKLIEAYFDGAMKGLAEAREML